MEYDYSNTVEYLLDWYDLNARILAWRENPIPYYVWISEIMLQQTRVEAVKLYFDRFVKELPDIKALAEAEEDKLLKLWEGLGYYNRVRNLQKAAQIIMRDYHGEMPHQYELLLKLPGIGNYTAGAIASIAFHQTQPAVDGNVLRVMKRVAGSFDDITKANVKKVLEQDIREIIPKDRPGDYNQALMELGATVCIPNGKPLCDQCPIMHLCRAYHQGTELQIPVKPGKKARKIEERTILIMEMNDNLLLRKRGSTGLLAGLWEFPNFEAILTQKDLENLLREHNIVFSALNSLGKGKHIFSHIEWHMIGYYIKLSNHFEVDNALLAIFHKSDPVFDVSKSYRLVTKKQIYTEYSIPSAFDIYRKQLEHN